MATPNPPVVDPIPGSGLNTFEITIEVALADLQALQVDPDTLIELDAVTPPTFTHPQVVTLSRVVPWTPTPA